jgi:hemoglobin-like flavoprotein
MGVMTGLSIDDIERVRSSFDRLWPTSTRTASLFYERLFEIAPEVRPLFRKDIDEQKRKFIATLAVIVGSLDNSSKLISLTDTLARQHGNFGVQPAHYTIVGEALMWSLERGLGDQWTPGVAESWSKAYGIISTFMIEHGRRN